MFPLVCDLGSTLAGTSATSQFPTQLLRVPRDVAIETPQQSPVTQTSNTHTSHSPQNGTAGGQLCSCPLLTNGGGQGTYISDISNPFDGSSYAELEEKLQIWLTGNSTVAKWFRCDRR